MKISSFREHLKKIASVKFFKSAMGYTHVKNREQYEWWELDELKGGTSPNIAGWEDSLGNEPSLIGVLNEADKKRRRSIADSFAQYGVPANIAARMIKTYIGYSPVYGGYFCQIGPYLNEGGGYVEQARGKFMFYVLRKRKATPETVSSTINKSIGKFVQKYGDVVELDASDFSYTMRVQEAIEESRKRQKHPVYRSFDSVDYANEEIKGFFEKSAIESPQSSINLNSKGYLKILKAMMGPWFTNEMSRLVQNENKTEEEIVAELITDRNKMKKIYLETYNAWLKSRQEGDPAALAIGQMPQFGDNTVASKSGAQIATTVGQPDMKGDTTKPHASMKLLKGFYDLKKEILQIINQQRSNSQSFALGENIEEETQTIANSLNENPIRKSFNKRIEYERIRLQKELEQLTERQRQGEDIGEETITRLTNSILSKKDATWTPDDVESVLSKFDKEDFENPEESISRAVALSNEVVTQSGYNDFKTAFHMAKAYFASQKVDGGTSYRIGSQNTIIFDPPEDFTNYTSDDVMKYYNAMAAGEPIPGEVTPEPVVEDATPEEIAEDIGEAVREDAMDIPEEAPEDDEKAKELEDLLGRSVVNLIRISEDLDKNGKYDAAEEVHKIIRKYRGRV